jgi:hypothetical protein
MKKAALLFSKGLDSLLAGKIIQSQGIEVIPVTYITPFFNWKFSENPRSYYKYCESQNFTKSILVDVTEEYLPILHKPRYGFGCLANPCIACKIFMLKKTKDLMDEHNFAFIITGEVLGQRPKSQNKWAMEVIKRESGVGDLLLRPLCAKLFPPSLPERMGWVEREKLYDISGRNRQRQFQLAKEFGINDFSTPAGGCLLTDPEIGRRMLKILHENRPLNKLTAQLSVLGRHFFEDNVWIVLGRNHADNQKILKIVNFKLPVYTLSEPAPVAVVVQGDVPENKIKELLVLYSKKASARISLGSRVELLTPVAEEV